MTSLQNLFVETMKVATKKFLKHYFYYMNHLIQSCQAQIIRCSVIDDLNETTVLYRCIITVISKSE